MSAVGEVLSKIYMALAGLPFIPFIAVYVMFKLRGMEKRKAVQWAMDITNVFLVGIVAALLSTRSGSSFGIYLILLVMLVGAGLIGGAQNRKRGKIDPVKIFRAVWRLSFFPLAILYVLLMSLELMLPST